MAVVASLVFSFVLVLVSYGVNRRITEGRLRIDPYRIVLTASAVLLLAILAESLVNPLFELWRGEKLWEYHVFPLHDSNVSALAFFVWTAYGIHLYFTRQSMELKLPQRLNNSYGMALITGIEAPFLFEVGGNLTFLALSNSFYAYYFPGDLAHLTSIQVIPVYIACVFVGLFVLRALERLPQHAIVPTTLFSAGVGWLLAG